MVIETYTCKVCGTNVQYSTCPWTVSTSSGATGETYEQRIEEMKAQDNQEKEKFDQAVKKHNSHCMGTLERYFPK